VLRNLRPIARFNTAARSNFGRGGAEVLFENDLCHAGAFDRLLIAAVFQSGRIVAGKRLAHRGLDFSKNYWPLGILLFHDGVEALLASLRCWCLPHVLILSEWVVVWLEPV
jgi:hypothetical protein